MASAHRDIGWNSMSGKSTKILFLAANPGDQGRLSLDREHREITAMIRASEHRDALEFICRWAVRPSDALLGLLEVRPAIVHISGHGTSDDQLLLVDAHGAARPVSTRAITHLFAALRGDIRLLVFNTCSSQALAHAVLDYVDCAIAMRGRMADDAAILFMACFYLALSSGRSLQSAFDAARAVLMMEGMADHDRPRLLTPEGVDPGQIVLVPASGRTILAGTAGEGG